MDMMVFIGLVIAWRLAGSPTLRSPFFKNATTEGVVRRPSSLAITTGSLPSITATQLLVVPRSIPIIFPIVCFFLFSLMIINDYAAGLNVQKWQFRWIRLHSLKVISPGGSKVFRV